MSAYPSRILMTTDTIGGVWTYSMELCASLARYGVQVTLATMGAPLSGEQHREAESIRSIAIAESSYRLEWMKDPWRDVDLAGRWLLRLARESGAELVHLNGFAHAVLPFGVPTVVVAHSDVLTWWRAVHGRDAPDEWDRYREILAQGLEAADAVVAPTAAQADALREASGWIVPIRVIHNGRDPSKFEPGEKLPLIFAAGRAWDDAKNLGTLVAAARGSRDVGRDDSALPWPVCIAGSTIDPDGNRVSLEPAHEVGVLGARALAGRLARASIYALPARYEPFGLSALEAALSGCALVLGDIASLREVWGDAAIYVNPDDHVGLRATLRELALDREWRKDAGKRARSRALLYTPDRQAAAYLSLYSDLIRHAGSRAREVECVW